MSAPEGGSDALRGALWMTGAVVSFSAIAVAGRQLTGLLDTFEIMFYRSLLGIAVMGSYLLISRQTVLIRKDFFGWHLARNVAHFTGQNLWLFAVMTAPLAQVFALEFTTPIWAILMAPLFLGETITRRGLACALLGFVGILIVARPSAETMTPGLLAAAGCAIMFAMTAMFTRRLTRTEPVAAILFYLATMQATFGLVLAGVDGQIALPRGEEILWVTITGIGGLTAHFSVTRALSLAPAGVVMPVDFARLPLIAVVGMLVYDEPLELAVFAGGAVILIANILNLRYGAAAARRV